MWVWEWAWSGNRSKMVVTELVSRIVIILIGVLYPAYCSFKAVKYKDHRQYTTWMMYWIVFALFLSIETFTDIFVSWFPFYYEVKIILVLWLALPCSEGAKNVYRKVIHRQLVEREEQIDDLLQHAGTTGLGMMKRASTIVVNQASTNIVQAAMKLANGQQQQQNEMGTFPYSNPEEPLHVRESHLQQRGANVEEGGVSVYVDTPASSDNEYKKNF